MRLILQTADVTGDAKNCRYPNRAEVTDAAGLQEAVNPAATQELSADATYEIGSNDNSSCFRSIVSATLTPRRATWPFI